MQKLEFALFADYFQFYIQDDDIKYGDLSDSWTTQATEQMLAKSDHGLGIGTVRNSTVPVFVEISKSLPTFNPTDWDRLNHAELACFTGRLVIAGCTDYFPDAQRIEVQPTTYAVVIGYKNITTVSENHCKGEDSYHLFLAPQS